ncbi:uncharacterized protein KD926_002478 [Aspergillus affinis]|uniref:uncharacterized protein n=1 Tax=Aspergillus affinis TaxID=1070780 RepID=UPI0022FEED9F|nr:uncharacterized protein KD926_002478 [Aspergillus affinis]KAI9036051.1 hypothetical protein KD926_002478 [Aspergillus affinis]
MAIKSVRSSGASLENPRLSVLVTRGRRGEGEAAAASHLWHVSSGRILRIPASAGKVTSDYTGCMYTHTPLKTPLPYSVSGPQDKVSPALVTATPEGPARQPVSYRLLQCTCRASRAWSKFGGMPVTVEPLGLSDPSGRVRAAQERPHMPLLPFQDTGGRLENPREVDGLIPSSSTPAAWPGGLAVSAATGHPGVYALIKQLISW